VVVKSRLVVVDVAVALFLVAWSAAEIYGSGANAIVGPLWANFAATGIASALVALRRWEPLLVLIMQSVVLNIPVLVWGASEALAGLLPVLVVFYTVVAHTPRRHVWLAVATMSVTLSLELFRDPLLQTPADYLGAAPFVVIVLVVGLIGEFARTRRLYLASLRERVDGADREAEQLARVAVLVERQRVARELHDVIAHGLTVMIRQVEAGIARLASDPARAQASLEAVASTGRDALKEVRLLVAMLEDNPKEESEHDQPHFGDLIRHEAPGLQAVQDLADRVTAAGLPVHVRDMRGLDGIPRGIDLAAYRIVQEALTNALRHAHADSATVSIRRDGHDLAVDIEDDGSGAPPHTMPAGFGLTGMRERARLFGGTISLQLAQPHGWRVCARLPLPQPDPSPLSR
jgi:signal transduction histidine kinase